MEQSSRWVRDLARARGGDRKAFDAVVEAHLPVLIAVTRRHLARIARSRIDAEDLLQEALLGAWQGIGSFRGAAPDTFEKWMLGIIGNQARKSCEHLHAAKRSPRREAPHSVHGSGSSRDALWGAIHSTPSGEAVRAEEEARLMAAFGSLPIHYQEAVWLRHAEARPIKDVAGQLGTSEDAVGGWLKRGLALLREALAAPEGGSR